VLCVPGVVWRSDGRSAQHFAISNIIHQSTDIISRDFSNLCAVTSLLQYPVWLQTDGAANYCRDLNRGSDNLVLLFSLAPITLFFLLSSSQYPFFKLLNVAFFGLAGLLGVVFLSQGLRIVTESTGKEGTNTRRMIFFLWVLLYGFVGSQMAWTLRPFMGEPGTPYYLFQELGGNFYADIGMSILQLLGFK
jgi:hypothetical protein